MSTSVSYRSTLQLQFQSQHSLPQNQLALGLALGQSWHTWHDPVPAKLLFQPGANQLQCHAEELGLELEQWGWSWQRSCTGSRTGTGTGAGSGLGKLVLRWEQELGLKQELGQVLGQALAPELEGTGAGTGAGAGSGAGTGAGTGTGTGTGTGAGMLHGTGARSCGKGAIPASLCSSFLFQLQSQLLLDRNLFRGWNRSWHWNRGLALGRTGLEQELALGQ
jgi:hypothetical protein